MNLIDIVYNKLRKEILHGKIAPGTRMVETQLAERFETSRTPIREALSMLKNEGLIANSPGGGVTVKESSARDVMEVMGIRKVLEAYALDLAFNKLTVVDIMQLELYLKQARHFVAENDIKAVYEVNTKLHRFIIEKSGDKRLKEVIMGLRESILRYRLATLHYPGNINTSIENHTKILEAIKSGDKKLAKKYLHDDIDSALEVMLKVVEEEKQEEKINNR